MTITIIYPLSGYKRTHRNMTQTEVNQLITACSNLCNDGEPVPMLIEVKD